MPTYIKNICVSFIEILLLSTDITSRIKQKALTAGQTMHGQTASQADNGTGTT